ncbi:MAG: hypothetical protein KIS94_00580 [Chitinophagales bacterium]|nr:hypothetical protein [Chitinophagales bacterium]
MQAEQNTAIRTNEIFVNEIVFYSRESISLFGFMHNDEEYVETEFLIERNQLQTLLSQNGKTGLEILWHIERLFVLPHEVPAGINLVEMFGTTQELKADEITLEVPVYEDENGNLLPTETWELLFVEHISEQAGARIS